MPQHLLLLLMWLPVVVTNRHNSKINQKPVHCSHLNLFLFRRLIFLEFAGLATLIPSTLISGETSSTLLCDDAQICNI